MIFFKKISNVESGLVAEKHSDCTRVVPKWGVSYGPLL
jgi:hypothetical protein